MEPPQNNHGRYKALSAAPTFGPKIPEVLLKRLDDAQRFQLETMSVIEQDLSWLKEHVVLAFNMSLETQGYGDRLSTLEKRFQTLVDSLNRAKVAPIKWVLALLGVAAHTTVTVLITIYVTNKLQGP